jgi:hypothetical protein
MATSVHAAGASPVYYPRDRYCDMPGCITILNRYNPGPDCLLHQEAAVGIRAQGVRDPNLARLSVAIDVMRVRMREAGEL